MRAADECRPASQTSPFPPWSFEHELDVSWGEHVGARACGRDTHRLAFMNGLDVFVLFGWVLSRLEWGSVV
jgi:hypothetical protein